MLNWIKFFLGQRNQLWETTNMNPIESGEQLQEILERSHSTPLFIFKHSTSCPISFAAFERISVLSKAPPPEFPPIYLVLVIEHRPISNEITQELGVRHASPQLLLVSKGTAVWNASHGAITADAAESAAEKFLLEKG